MISESKNRQGVVLNELNSIKSDFRYFMNAGNKILS